MKKMLPYYERELAFLRDYRTEFIEQYPHTAAAMGIEGGVDKDPDVERWTEGTALLNARIAKLLDDSQTEFTAALLSVNYPHYLQPFPSTAIARFDYSGVKAAKMSAASVIPRGTMLHCAEQDGVICKFRTAYDVTIAPLALARVKFRPIISLSPALPRAPNLTSSIELTIESTGAMSLAQLGVPSLRVFIDGEPALCAALRDTLFLRASCAYVEADGAAAWSALDAVPLSPVGFARQDALIPFKASSHPAYRLLLEYFAFPDKFNFFDIDLAALARHAPDDCRRLTLHLALSGLHPDADTARLLTPLSSKNLLLACAPVVNLFQQGASPIELTHTATEYALMADPRNPRAYDIHSVDAVHVLRDTPKGASITEFRPYYSLRHGEGGGKKGHYWITRRDETLAATCPGREMRIALVDIDLDPLAIEMATVSIELTCSNRDLPGRLSVGAPDGDLHQENAADACPIRFLRKPGPPYRFPSGAHWRLISHLALNHRALIQDGLEAFTELLTLYDLPQSAVSRRRIGGVVGLAYRPARAWLRDGRGDGLAHGVEVHLTIDEEAFAGASVHLFAQVIDHFLGLYVHLNSFIQLVILSKSNAEELIRCRPRNGDLNLV